MRLAKGILDDAVGAIDGAAAGVVETGPPWEVLELVADREGGRLLVVAARGQSGLKTAMFGSVAAEVAPAPTVLSWSCPSRPSVECDTSDSLSREASRSR
jgi:hypothetical protein